jgi:glycosyltransferase involved in cell wall biosynthesis
VSIPNYGIMNNMRLNVLIVAKELSPIKGSENAIGWNIVTRLSVYHDVTVLYASGSQFSRRSYVDALNRYFLTSPPIKGLTFVNIDYPKISRLFIFFNSVFAKLSQIGLPFLFYQSYKFWQKEVLREAKRLHKVRNFDIVHQVTQITFREPGFLWKLGIPFFWGPTGGITNFPKEFYTSLSAKSKVMEKIRSLANIYHFNFVPRIKKANRIASVIYSYSKEDAWLLQKRTNGHVKQMLDVGTYIRHHYSKHVANDTAIIKGIWCGQLTYRKAPSILLQALALNQITRERIKLKIIGKGPLEKSLRRMVEGLELKNIEWVREVSHDEIFELMGQTDFLIHTSLREATSSVIPEALSMGVPVICHDAFGMSIAVNDTCGIKIALKSPEHSIVGFNEAMKRLILDRDLLKELKAGASKRAYEISWEVMAETMAKDYLKVSGNNLP